MLGKPVVGYFKKDITGEQDSVMRSFLADCPIVSADAESLYDVLKGLLESSEHRKQIGDRSRAFALKWHSVQSSARRFDSCYTKILN